MNNRQQNRPWDKQDGETAAAYAAFQVYLNLGVKRSLRAAYDARPQKGHKKATTKDISGTWKTWSRKHHWTVRACAWDAYAAKQVRDGVAKALKGAVAKSVAQVIAEYAEALEGLKDLAGELQMLMRARLEALRESNPGAEYTAGKDDAIAIDRIGMVLGRANRDLLLIMGGPALEPDDEDDAPGSRRTPEPINLRPTVPPELYQ